MADSGKRPANEVVHWLVSEGPNRAAPSDLLAGYCSMLRAAGIPVDRSTLGAPLLHPIAQSSYVFWDIDNGARQRWFQWTPDALETMRASPIYPIYTGGTSSSVRLSNETERARYPIGGDLWEEGYVQYEALALRFSDGSYKALTMATKSAAGFSSSDRELVAETLPALALVFESFIARNTARTLMETYVGKRAGLRVLDGEIARGDGTRIDAVIWFSDLRGFTQLARTRSESEVLDLLNEYFGLLTGAIEHHGGEVLKFIGDAMLAVFAHEDDLPGAVTRAEAAAFDAMASHRTKHAGSFRFGIALHPGTVFYGNIGGGTRLDFTVIGQAVNIASRIEGLCAALAQPLLVSAELAANSARKWRSLGMHELKGAGEPIQIFVPEMSPGYE